jgi:hypothetical protein
VGEGERERSREGWREIVKRREHFIIKSWVKAFQNSRDKKALE